MKKWFLAVAAIGMVGSPAYGETYKVTLTRKDNNFYQVDFGKIYVKTKYCYEYAMGQEAIIDTTRMRVIFLGYSESSCDMEMILQKIS